MLPGREEVSRRFGGLLRRGRGSNRAGQPPGPELDTQGEHAQVRRLVESPVFILCSVRSGSTLLRVLLNSHSEICAPHELHLQTIEVRIRQEYAADVLRTIGLPRRELEYVLWDRILADFLERSGKSVIVEKTPSSVVSWPRLREAWPNARYIFLLRHPESIVESSLKRDRRPGARRTAVDNTLRFVEALEEARHELDGHTLRYEDLTNDPEGELRRVCSHLGVAFEATMLDYGSQDHGLFRPAFGDTSEKLRSGRVQAMRELPSPSDIDDSFRAIAHAWGYSR